MRNSSIVTKKIFYNYIGYKYFTACDIKNSECITVDIFWKVCENEDIDKMEMWERHL